MSQSDNSHVDLARALDPWTWMCIPLAVSIIAPGVAYQASRAVWRQLTGAAR